MLKLLERPLAIALLCGVVVYAILSALFPIPSASHEPTARQIQDSACDHYFLSAKNFAEAAATTDYLNAENAARVSQTYSALYEACIIRHSDR